MSRSEVGLSRRLVKLGGGSLRRGERLRVVLDGPKVQVFDERDEMPVIEVTPFVINTRTDRFPDGLDDEQVYDVMRAAKRFVKANER